MKTERLNDIKHLLFSAKDLGEVLRITQASANLACHRYARQGFILRLKRDLYILSKNWKSLQETGKFQIANRLQVPSYISFTSALAYHGITTQITREFYESTALVRTMSFEIGDVVFQYRKFQKRLYFGFEKKQDFFIATPEKAMCDALYLVSFFRYRLDMNAIDSEKLNFKELGKMMKWFPERTKNYMQKIWKS